MIFADTEFAARIEQSTCRILVDSAAAAVQRRGSAGGFTHKLAGGVATYTEPGSPLNKLAGLGFEGVPSEDRLAAIEQDYFKRGSPVRIELSTLGDPAIGAMLTRRGYVLTSHENVLALALDANNTREETGQGEIEVARCGDADFDAWIDVMVTGFASPDAQGIASHESFPRDIIERAVADMSAAPGFARYTARRGGELAGGASVHMGEGIAHLCGAATLPQHRRRGVQAALFEARLRDAAREGCDLAVIVTMPGSKSQQNAQRRSFSLLYARAILVCDRE